MKLFSILLVVLSITGCGGGGSNNNTPENTSGSTPGNTSGVITLSGDDSSIVGTQLNTGFIDSSLAAGSQPDYIVIVDQDSSVTFTPPNVLTPNISDIDNGFVLVVMDDSPGSGTKGISMSITVDGTKFDYACTTPVATFIECGINSISLDIENKMITFNTATVINTDTSTTLTLDGTLTWMNKEGSTNNNSGDGTVGGGGVATELEGKWIYTCEYNDVYGPSFVTYDSGSITFSGNTFISSWTEYSDPACTVIDEEGYSTGTFIIENAITTSSGLSAKEIDVTILTMDGSDFTLTYYDIFRIDSDRLYFGDQGSYDIDIDDWEYNGLTTDKRPIDIDFGSYSTKE